MNDPRVVIVGAGPAGLAAGLELARRGVKPLILERNQQVGGLARTVWHNGYGFDIGGHRFFTKSREILDLWKSTLGVDFIEVPRLSRIYYRGHYFAYPIKAVDAVMGLGPFTSARAVASYAAERLKPKREPKSFEDWIVQRFGRVLFSIFFKSYTEKVWGIPCDQLGREWADQRIRGLDLAEALRTAIGLRRRGGSAVKSLIEQFWYPRLGAGQMHEAIASQVRALGGEIRPECDVTGFTTDGTRVTEVLCGPERSGIPVSHVFVSAPITKVARSLRPNPGADVLDAAGKLRFRGHLSVNLITASPPPFKDTWLYIHSPEVRMARIQNYARFSAGMVASPESGAVGVEYFAFPGDDLWSRSDSELVALACEELEAVRLLPRKQIVDGFVVREADAYPAYYLGHQQHFETVFQYLQQFKNLTLIGRAGMYRYNNQDHAMLTGLYAARNYLGLTNVDLFSINADQEYLEEMRPLPQA
ncbi:MAG: NAD(P)/FAD-dependent oxidoreductase [Chloroflexi bacterium]|nr:NAD(P)/FAD-dependent oxidoreductase [Chloroflexota bacterium]